MKKSELKDGMKVVTANGEEWLVQGETLVSLIDGFNPLELYKDDLSPSRHMYNTELFSIQSIFVFDTYRWVEHLPDYKIREWWPEKLSMSFVLNGKSEIEILGNKTKVLFSTDKNPEEVFTGTSTCMEGDVYNKKKGIRIATYKALQKYVQNELDKMTK